MKLTPDLIADLLRQRANGLYGGEAVTQLEHALQCATLAQQEGASPSQIIAALLHDLGHLVNEDDTRQPHEKLAAQMLAELFGPAVTEPIRLHVEAKRYLCATDAGYWSGLSPMSQRSLIWQGGPFSQDEARSFISQPHAANALRLRHWDDAAKVVGATTPALDDFLTLMASVMLPATEAQAA